MKPLQPLQPLQEGAGNGRFSGENQRGGYLKTRILAFFQIRKSAENPEISEIGRKMRCNQCRNETIATIAGMAGMAGMADFLGKIKNHFLTEKVKSGSSAFIEKMKGGAPTVHSFVEKVKSGTHLPFPSLRK